MKPELFWLVLISLIGGTITGSIALGCHYHNQKIEIMTRSGYSLKPVQVGVQYLVEWVKEDKQ